MKDGIFIGDRYEVLSKVGSGGMADVYKGKDHKLNRFVAIKILKKEYREDELFVRKFQSEAQAAAGLMHPNIVNVYDVGEESGLYFMVMELVEGITLKDYITKKGVLSAKEVISIAIQVANGIEAAHMHNIVHRDIKPQNIIISKEGKVKVTDFGIAKATSSNTISTNALGSVHYTSPEQARGGFSDFKSDIYSLGITMYEMATGHVPFDGDTAVSIAIKHLQEEITPPSEYVEDIPYSLEQIILKCTQKSADRRYPNINTLREDLKRSLVDPEGDFVVIGPMRVMDETVMFTPEDMGRIQKENRRNLTEDDAYDEYDDEYDDAFDEDEYDDYDEYDDNPKKRKSKNGDVNPKMAKIMKILTIVAVVIIVFVMIVIVGKATGLLKFGPSTATEDDADKNKKVKVPDLKGMTYDEAKEELAKYDLGIERDGEEESTEYEEGEIISHSPDAGQEVKKNTTVKVVISSGKVAEKIEMPDLVGQSQSAAKQVLLDKGFKEENIKIEWESSSEVDNDDVIRTDPGEGEEVSVDSVVTLYISNGEDKATVPSLKGKTESDAIAALESAGLSKGQISREYSDSVEKGRVISQSTSAGKRVAKGTSVGFTVSQGKKPEEKTEVPNIIGMGEYNAKNAIQNAGLVWSKGTSQYSDKYAAGEVISCTPGVGNSVSPGTTVTVIISLGKAPTTDGGDSSGTP